MTLTLIRRLALALALAVTPAACAEDEGEQCMPCNLSSPNGTDVCPHIIKSCSFGTIDVQSCSGPANSDEGCCAETAAEITCPNFATAGDTLSVEADGTESMMSFSAAE